MDRVTDLADIVQREVEGYAVAALDAITYAVNDQEQQRYIVLHIPDYPRDFEAGIVVAARIVSNMVIIDEDTTDKPLVDELVRAGISREKIILTYAGETVPEM